MRTTSGLGAHGERIAAAYLTDRGLRVLDRNWRCRDGELDIVARDGDALVFCEVKTRRGTGFGDPLEAVTPRKQRTVRSITEQYLLEKSPDFHTLRFDAIGILLKRDGARITHVKDAF